MEQLNNHIQGSKEKALSDGKNLAEKARNAAKSMAQKIGSNGDGVDAGESGESELTKRIESVTSKIPSATFLSLAVASVGLSLMLRMFGRKDDAQFVGHWVPTILTLGVYNKLVKLEGSE